MNSKFLSVMFVMLCTHLHNICAGDEQKELAQKFAAMSVKNQVVANSSRTEKIIICHETNKQYFVSSGGIIILPVCEKAQLISAARNAAVLTCTKDNPVCDMCLLQKK